MNHPKKRFLCVAVLLLSSVVSAQDEVPSVALASVSSDKDVISLTHWDVSDGDLVCIVSQSPDKLAPTFKRLDGKPWVTRTLTIYRRNDTKIERIFEYETPQGFLNMYPLGELDDRLVTIWGGGSGYSIKVFAFLNGKVQQVLDTGSQYTPEFISDEHGYESILVSSDKFEKGTWSIVHGNTTVYKWNGRRYDVLGVVPWKKRFQCVSKESCVTLK